MFGRPGSVHFDHVPASQGSTNSTEAVPCSEPQTIKHMVDPSADLTRCFLRLANLPSYPLDRLSRYEATLCRQVGRILFALDALDRRKPQTEGRRFLVSGRQELPAYERDEC